MPRKSKKQIEDEINACWEEREFESGQITLGKLLKNDKYVFFKNITWVGKDDEWHPFFYANINDKERILVNYPYNEIDLKAFRNGDLEFSNKSLFIRN